MDKTFMVPFAALVIGRLRFTLADIKRVGLVAVFSVYPSIYLLHGLVSDGISLL